MATINWEQGLRNAELVRGVLNATAEALEKASSEVLDPDIQEATTVAAALVSAATDITGALLEVDAVRARNIFREHGWDLELAPATVARG